MYLMEKTRSAFWTTALYRSKCHSHQHLLPVTEHHSLGTRIFLDAFAKIPDKACKNEDEYELSAHSSYNQVLQ